MRVLVLNGSPKGDKSNTYRLTSAFLDGLRQTQPVEAETIEVGKLHLLPCRGCFACWSKTPGKCVLQDDMAGVIEKILAANKEDIENAFWPKDNNPENKIYSHISTLKSSLKDFPEYQIVTEKGGYRLVISSNE